MKMKVSGVRAAPSLVPRTLTACREASAVECHYFFPLAAQDGFLGQAALSEKQDVLNGREVIIVSGGRQLGPSRKQHFGEAAAACPLLSIGLVFLNTSCVGSNLCRSKSFCPALALWGISGGYFYSSSVPV